MGDYHFIHSSIIVLTFLDGVLFRTKNFIPDYRYTKNFIDEPQWILYVTFFTANIIILRSDRSL